MPEKNEYDGMKYLKEKKSHGVFRILFIVLIASGVAYMGYGLFSGWNLQVLSDTSRGNYQGSSGLKVEAHVAAGKKLYGNLCVGCHGEKAKGGVGPDLTVSKYKYGKERLDITKTISEGRPGGMPSFRSQVNNEEIISLVEFILTLK